MTENEQINEMAKIIAEYEDCGDCKNCYFHNCCSAEYHAIALYNADYRKQVVGEWIENKEICSSPYCSICGAIGNKGNFCHHCGAKMKGSI